MRYTLRLKLDRGFVKTATFDYLKNFKATPKNVTICLLDKCVKYAIHGPQRVLNAEIQKVREIQLAAANRSTDDKINPHMMPFKNKTQTIMQAESQYSTGVERFLSLAKTLFRK